MEFANEPEISCVFCGLGFTSVENIESHIQKNHQLSHTDNLEIKKSLIFDDHTLDQHFSNKENDDKPCLNGAQKIITVKQSKFEIIKYPVLSKPTNYNCHDTEMSSCKDLLKQRTLKTENFKTIYKHECYKCFKHFLYHSTLLIHLQKHLHDEKSKYQCDKCGSRYSTKQILLRHTIKNCVLGIKPLKHKNPGLQSCFCERCQRTFTSISYLELHQRRICRMNFKDECMNSSKCTLLSDASNNIISRTTKRCNRTTLSRNKSRNNILKIRKSHSSPQLSAQMSTRNINQKYSISSNVPLKDTILSLSVENGGILEQSIVDQKPNCQWIDYNDKSFQKPFQCEICKKYFSNRSSLSNHIKSHYSSRGQPFICQDCNQRFVNLITLQDHRRQKCSQKALQFKSPLQEDIKYKPKPIYSLSNFNGVSQVPLWQPITTNNSTSQPVTCVHCNGVFYDRLELEEHALSKHSDEHGNILCLLCERTFTTNMALRVHLTKSHGFANGGCPGVSQNLPPMPKLDTNYNISNDIPHKKRRRRLVEFDKEFPCEFCNRKFSTCQALGNHRRACINMPNNLVSVNNATKNPNSKLHSIESLIFDNKTSRSTSFKDDKNVFLVFN